MDLIGMWVFDFAAPHGPCCRKKRKAAVEILSEFGACAFVRETWTTPRLTGGTYKGGHDPTLYASLIIEYE